MSETRERLLGCFSSVFPSLSRDSMIQASVSNTAGWDSVAAVTLVAAIEEEFGIEMEVNDLARLVSFETILEYLETKGIQNQN